MVIGNGCLLIPYLNTQVFPIVFIIEYEYSYFIEFEGIV
jgi:hypothetical protein